jgi:photosystem II stability/assembly factor-like uncharacterized protein
VDEQTAWVTGSKGGVWRTTDGGQTWMKVSPRSAKGLELRDVEAQDALHAVVLAIGVGDDSRIYHTDNGGLSWSKAFVNDDERAFYDCVAMYPNFEDGLAVSDPVNGKFRIVVTHDGGATWKVIRPYGMPRAKPGEYAFAASGTCLVTDGETDAYLGSGGGASRIFVSRDQGRHWRVKRSTIPTAESGGGGVFSVAVRPGQAVAVGGDYTRFAEGTDMSAYSPNRGRSWTNGGDLGGYRSAVEWLRADVAIAVGPNGSDLTRDGGKHWSTFSHADLDSVQCVEGACWGSGVEGGVVRLH